MTPPRAAEVLEYIVQFKRDHDGNAPTVRQIGAALTINSTSTVYYYLNCLARAGMIERKDGRILIVGAEWKAPPPRQIVVPPALRGAGKAKLQARIDFVVQNAQGD